MLALMVGLSVSLVARRCRFASQNQDCRIDARSEQDRREVRGDRREVKRLSRKSGKIAGRSLATSGRRQAETRQDAGTAAGQKERRRDVRGDARGQARSAAGPARSTAGSSGRPRARRLYPRSNWRRPRCAQLDC